MWGNVGILLRPRPAPERPLCLAGSVSLARGWLVGRGWGGGGGGGGGGEGYRALYASARSSPVQDMSFRRGLSYGPPGRIRGLLTAGSVALRLGTNGGRLGVSPAPYDSQWAALLHGTCAPPPAVRVRRNGEWRGGGIIMALLRTCISCRSMHLARGCRDVV